MELWSELQHRASQGTAQAIVAGNLTVAQIAARTSSTINTEHNGDGEFEEGALFDETASAYTRLRAKTENIMSELLTNNMRHALSSYSRINPWASLAPVGSQTSDAQLSPSAELDALLQSLQTLLAYLVRAVGTVPLRRLGRQMLHVVDTVVFNQVILGHSFSGSGVAQLSVDTTAISKLVSKYLDAGTIDLGVGRLNQAIRLLGIPVKEGKADDDTQDDEDESTEVYLIEAGKRLFEGSGDDAKKLLDEMSLDRLSVADARKVLARRVELGS